MTPIRFAQLIITLVSLWLAGSAQAVDPSDLLPPLQAFKLSANVKNADTLHVRWDIADGYYLYRKRFAFSTATPGMTLGEPAFPPGQIHKDEFLGEVETYRGQVEADIPFRRTAGSPADFMLMTVSQGCSDLGVCYPPQKQAVALSLPAAPVSSGPAATAATTPVAAAGAEIDSTVSAEALPGSSPASSGVQDFFSSLGSKLGLGNSGNKFLEPDQAYAASFETRDGNTLIAHWDIAPGYYMYRDKFAFRLTQADGATLNPPQFPPSETKTDASFGKVQIYHHEVSIALPLTRTGSGPGKVMLEATYQGCAEAGFCYPPLMQSVELRLPAAREAGAAAGANQAPLNEQDRIADSLTSDSLPLTLLSFFGFGLLLAFTPCVFPMIPILSSIIAGQGAEQTTRKAFVLSLVYVLAMALTYTVAGVIAGRFGENLQAASQNAWVLGIFSGVFVLLALSMFGFYQLQLPGSWQSRLADVSGKQRSGNLAGVAVMGFLSALIVGPCVAAPLAGALIYIGQTGDAVLGGLALFALGLGMGAPLLVIGTSLGNWLPRAGGWMDAVKAVFGVLLLGVAIWMLERIIPAALSLVLWALLLIISAVYMGALDRITSDTGGWRKLWKGLGLAMLLYGAFVLAGAASGGKDLFQPLQGLTTGIGGTIARELPFKRVKTLAQLKYEIQQASLQGKPVMFDLYADWCVSCKEMAKYTFADASVQQALANSVLLQADVTANDAEDSALLRGLNLIGPPSILFFGADGTARPRYTVVGFMDAAEFLSQLREALI